MREIRVSSAARGQLTRLIGRASKMRAESGTLVLARRDVTPAQGGSVVAPACERMLVRPSRGLATDGTRRLHYATAISARPLANGLNVIRISIAASPMPHEAIYIGA